MNIIDLQDQVRAADTPIEKLKVMLAGIAQVQEASEMPPLPCEICKVPLTVFRGKRCGRPMMKHPISKCVNSGEWTILKEPSAEEPQQ